MIAASARLRCFLSSSRRSTRASPRKFSSPPCRRSKARRRRDLFRCCFTELDEPTKRARRVPGPSAVDLYSGLQPELVVNADAGNEELIVVVVVATEKRVAADRSTGV